MSEEDDIKKINEEISELSETIAALENRKFELIAKRKHLQDQQEKRENDRLQDNDWENGDFPWSSKLHSGLQEIFHINAFRPLQQSSINASLSGHDVFLIMPTGGGKSLCFQLPALIASKGVTLVVSPLVSLMEDQVMALKKIGAEAEMLNADTPRAEVTRIMNAMVDPKSLMRLLYVTPEKLAKSKRFMTKLQNCHKLGLFNRLAIDEVHCCSQWGHDFRPDYKFLGVMKSLFPNVPIIGLTATSTTRVTEDCKKMLSLKSCLVFKAPFNRPNLFYQVRLKPETQDECCDQIATLMTTEFKDQSGIIYTLSIKDVDTLSRDLQKRGLRVAPYHANLESKSRSKIHSKWLSGSYQAVVATIAFGMGIDKPNVRFVLHHSISKSMENFYQESGRAGRDDQPAKCIAFFKFGDVFRLSTMVFTEQTGLEKLYAMVTYCINYDRCRRSVLADHFGESWHASECMKMCDICSGGKASLSGGNDYQDVAQVLLKAMARAKALQERLTPLKLVNLILGKAPPKLRLDMPRLVGRVEAEHLILHLLLHGVLKEDFAFTPYTTLTYLVAGAVTSTGMAKNLHLPLEVLSSSSSKKRKASSKAQGDTKSAKQPVIVLDDDDNSHDDDFVKSK